MFHVQQPPQKPVQKPQESPAPPQAPYDWAMGLYLYVGGFVGTALVFGLTQDMPRGVYEFLLLLMQVYIWLALLRLTSILGNRP